MNRREFLLTAGALAAPFGAEGQSTRVPRIGAIIHSGTYAPIVEGLLRGLKELGVAEGKDVALEVFDAKGEVKAIEAAARRFERERVRLIYCTPTSAATAVKRATTEVPVFFCVGTDPIAVGLVESFAKPGGRLTGVHFLTTDLTAKRPELRAALAALKAGDADALFTVSDALIVSQSQLLIDTAKTLRMPTMVNIGTMVERGALVSYGVDLREIGRESAKNVQRMLAGARPGDLPVETVTRLAFVLNRRTAQEIGLAVPPAMLVRFDRVIQ